MANFWGVAPNTSGHGEKFISGMGGFIGILLTMWVSHHFLGVQGAALLVASMGASAVLLFAVPHGVLSQPWALIGGHFISALVGVSCAKLVAEPFVAAPLAVGLAITAMHYLRCTHPPGGATAITAVIGGEQVHELGYQYVFTPVMLNAGLMLLAALAVNYSFAWRRYPVGWKKQTGHAAAPGQTAPQTFVKQDFEYAIKEMGTIIDVSEQDLAKIYRLAVKHAWQLSEQAERVETGCYYSNGETANDLSVRRVMELSADGETVKFRTVAGYGEGVIQTAARPDFENWLRYEVIWKDDAWRRVRPLDA